MNSILTALSLIVCQFLVYEVQGIADAKTIKVHELAPEVASIPDGYVPHPDIGFAYKVYNASVSWTRASELCRHESAELAVIDTDKKLEYARIPPLADDQLRHVGIHWVGADWVSVNNETLPSSVPWSAGEPGPIDNGFNCVMVGWGKLSFKGLINGRCDKFVGDYICQIPLPKSS